MVLSIGWTQNREKLSGVGGQSGWVSRHERCDSRVGETSMVGVGAVDWSASEDLWLFDLLPDSGGRIMIRVSLRHLGFLLGQ